MIEKSLLKRMQLPIVFKTFDGENFSMPHAANRHLARARGRAIQQDRASAATPLAAAVF